MRSGRPGGVRGGHKGSAGRPCVCPEGRGEIEGAPRDVQQPTAFSPFLPNLPQSWVFIFWILAKINKQINVQQEVGPQLHPGGGGGGAGGQALNAVTPGVPAWSAALSRVSASRPAGVGCLWWVRRAPQTPGNHLFGKWRGTNLETATFSF